jgi:hypothetical protein
MSFFEEIRRRILIFSLLGMLFVSCGREIKDCEFLFTSVYTNKDNKTGAVELYLDNSISMAGFDKNFRQVPRSILNELNTLNIEEKGFLIHNKDDLHYNVSIEPYNFSKVVDKFGENSKIDALLEAILNRYDNSKVCLFITDGIYSTNDLKDIEHKESYEGNIQKLFRNVLNKYKNLAMYVLLCRAKFDGYYYDAKRKTTKLNEDRPYLIFIIGEKKIAQKCYDIINKSKDKNLIDIKKHIVFERKQSNDIIIPIDYKKGLDDAHKKWVISKTQNKKPIVYVSDHWTCYIGIKFEENDIDINPNNIKCTVEPGNNDVKITSIKKADDVFFKKMPDIKKKCIQQYDVSHILTVTGSKLSKDSATLYIKYPFIRKEYEDWYTKYHTEDDTGDELRKNKILNLKYLIEGLIKAFDTNSEYLNLELSIKRK